MPGFAHECAEFPPTVSPLFALLYLAGNEQEAFHMSLVLDFFLFKGSLSLPVFLLQGSDSIQHLEATLTVAGSRETN